MRIAADDPRLAAADLNFRIDGSEAAFTLPPATDRPKDLPTEVRVSIRDGELRFFPERSAAQKRLIKALGLGQ